eukprot:5242878-Amphidinium_carterae.1
MEKTLEHNPTTTWFHKTQERRLCVCQQTINNLHHGVHRRSTCCWRLNVECCFLLNGCAAIGVLICREGAQSCTTTTRLPDN